MVTSLKNTTIVLSSMLPLSSRRLQDAYETALTMDALFASIASAGWGAVRTRVG